MKKSKSQLSLLILTLACIVALVGIQINSIFKAARMQEAQFNYSVNMAMNRILDLMLPRMDGFILEIRSEK